jgi:uncharacterized membrane protein
MEIELLIGLFLTILPITELRVGLPLVINYVIKNGLLIWPYFLLVLFLNVVIIFVLFLFLDFLHEKFMRFDWYRKMINPFLRRAHRKANRFQSRFESIGFLALILFVGIPLPGTGAWTGALVSWILGLDRKKSTLAIIAGVLIAGLIVLAGSLGFLSSIY